MAMHQHASHPVDDRPCPLGFIIVPAFIGALVWLGVLLYAMP